MIIFTNNKSTKFCLIALHINRFIHKRKVVPFFCLKVYTTRTEYIQNVFASKNVRRILVRGVNAPLPPEAKNFLKIWLRNGAFWSTENALFCMFSLFNFSSIFHGGRSADPICPHVRTPMFANLAGSCVSALANDVPVYFRRYLHGPVFLAHRYPSPAHAIHIRLWQRNPLSQRQPGTSGRARYDAIAPFSHQILIYVQTRPIWSFYYFVSSGT